MEKEHMELLNEEDEEKVTGGTREETPLFRLLKEGEEVGCSSCHKKYKRPFGITGSYPCPHCGHDDYWNPNKISFRKIMDKPIDK